jgi:hypothetical protein
MDIHDKIAQAKLELIKLIYTDWRTIDLFSPTWFGTVAFILFSYFLCFKLLDKCRLTKTLLYGALLTVMVSLFDIIGVEYVRWTYLTRIIPIVPSLFLFDFTLIPLYYMLVYQYCRSWKSFIICNTIVTGIVSFVLFPLMTALKMFELNNWSYVYFYPCIFTFALVSKIIVAVIVNLENKCQKSVQ